jgi:hypothetical protein
LARGTLRATDEAAPTDAALKIFIAPEKAPSNAALSDRASPHTLEEDAAHLVSIVLYDVRAELKPKEVAAATRISKNVRQLIKVAMISIVA